MHTALGYFNFSNSHFAFTDYYEYFHLLCVFRLLMCSQFTTHNSQHRSSRFFPQESSIMSTAMHEFFTSELKHFLPSDCVITVISDNAKPLVSSFKCNKGRSSLKTSSSSGGNKKDRRWGETPSVKSQCDCAPSGHARHTRPAVADSAIGPGSTSSNQVGTNLGFAGSTLMFYPIYLY